MCLSYDIKNKESLEKLKTIFLIPVVLNSLCALETIFKYLSYFLFDNLLFILKLGTFRKILLICLFIKELFKFTPNPSCFGGCCDVVL